MFIAVIIIIDLKLRCSSQLTSPLAKTEPWVETAAEAAIEVAAEAATKAPIREAVAIPVGEAVARETVVKPIYN